MEPFQIAAAQLQCSVKQKWNQGFIAPSFHMQQLSLALDGEVLLKEHFCKHYGVHTSPAITKGSVFIWAGCDYVSRHKHIALAITTPAVNVTLPDAGVGSVSIFISIAFLSNKVDYSNEAVQ